MEEEKIVLWWAFESNFEYDVPCSAAAAIRPAKPKYTFADKQIQFNQSVNDPYGCTRYWAATTIANNRWVEFTKEDRDWFRANAPRYWYVHEQWMFTSRAGDMVVERLNQKFPEQKWIKEAIQFYENDIVALIKQWRVLHMGSQVNEIYTWYIYGGSIPWPWWRVWGWHSRSFADPTGSSKLPSIVENYVRIEWVTQGIPYNIIAMPSWFWLVDYKQFHNQVFIYYPTVMETEIPYPYMSVDQAEALEKKYPDLFSATFSESVRAWVDASKKWLFSCTDCPNQNRRKFVKYTGIDWVMKMMIDLEQLR